MKATLEVVEDTQQSSTELNKQIERIKFKISL
jgi:hypothetical protein